MTHHYSRQDIVNALKDIGLKKGDVVFSHSNVGFLGRAQNGMDQQDVFEIILEAFTEVIGTEGTLVVPTFTYSFSQGKVFDLVNSPSTCGFFTELLRLSSNATRSLDPSISVAAIGARAATLTENVPENAYTENSFFDRFFKAKGIICNINFDAGSTFVHYVERALKVPYRFDKTFTGTIIDTSGKIEHCTSTIWVRQLQSGTEAQFETFNSLAVERKLYKKARVGRGFVGAISAIDTFNLIKEILPIRPWFLTKAGHLSDNPICIL